MISLDVYSSPLLPENSLRYFFKFHYSLSLLRERKREGERERWGILRLKEERSEQEVKNGEKEGKGIGS